MIYNLGMDEEMKIQGDIDLNEALREFEVKARQQQTSNPTPTREVVGNSKVVELVMKASGGVIKKQQHAEYILLLFVVSSLVASMFLFFGRGNAEQRPSPAAIEQMKEMQWSLSQRK